MRYEGINFLGIFHYITTSSQLDSATNQLPHHACAHISFEVQIKYLIPFYIADAMNYVCHNGRGRKLHHNVGTCLRHVSNALTAVCIETCRRHVPTLWRYRFG